MENVGRLIVHITVGNTQLVREITSTNIPVLREAARDLEELVDTTCWFVWRQVNEGEGCRWEQVPVVLTGVAWSEPGHWWSHV